MQIRTRRFAVHIALIAMILRALLPAGWMPGTPADGPGLVICTMDGGLSAASGHGQDHKNPDDGQHHAICPFAAAAHLAQASDSATTVASLISSGRAISFDPDDAVLHRPPHTSQAPRAPPTLL